MQLTKRREPFGDVECRMFDVPVFALRSSVSGLTSYAETRRRGLRECIKFGRLRLRNSESRRAVLLVARGVPVSAFYLGVALAKTEASADATCHGGL